MLSRKTEQQHVISYNKVWKQYNTGMLTIRMYNLSDFLCGWLLISGLKGCTGIGAVVPIFRLFFFEYLHIYEANIEFDLYGDC